MADPKDARPTLPGVYDRETKAAITGIEVAGAVVSVLWLILAAVYFLTGHGGDATASRFMMVLMVIVLPVALIWVATITVRTSRTMREDSARLKAAIDALRQAYVSQAQAGRNEVPSPAVLKRLDEIAAGQKNLEKTFAMLTATHRPEPADLPSEDENQPALSLGTPAEALQPPLSNADFIRALHFPETAEDEDGFAALRRALKDRKTAQLVQASQDVLTLLSQDGIYMDDLMPDLARPEIWRAFAKGSRGRPIAALGGIRDRASLALAAGRMKQDAIFRDAAHHFLRRFDRSFADFEPHASDAEITEFAATRTARAFMLLGRVAGTFD
jgi:hypothetical protein